MVHSKAFVFLDPEMKSELLKRASMDPVGEAIQDGVLQENADAITAPHSAFSYEDLPSDKFGAQFGAHFFNPNSKQTFSEQIREFFKTVLKATKPEEAPNYNTLPENYPKKPTRTNKTTTPVFVKDNP